MGPSTKKFLHIYIKCLFRSEEKLFVEIHQSLGPLEVRFLGQFSSPVGKGQKIAGSRSRVCPNFFCSLLFTGMWTLILWIIGTT